MKTIYVRNELFPCFMNLYTFLQCYPHSRRSLDCILLKVYIFRVGITSGNSRSYFRMLCFLMMNIQMKVGIERTICIDLFLVSPQTRSEQRPQNSVAKLLHSFLFRKKCHLQWQFLIFTELCVHLPTGCFSSVGLISSFGNVVTAIKGPRVRFCGIEGIASHRPIQPSSWTSTDLLRSLNFFVASDN